MKDEGAGLPKNVVETLRAVRAEERRTRLLSGACATVALSLSLLCAALAIDWLLGIRSAAARWTLTLLTALMALAALICWCLAPLIRSRSLPSIARDIDQQSPELEERLSTITELARSGDPAAVRGSESLLKRVGEQAADMSKGVQAAAIVSKAGLRRAARCAIGAVAGVALLFCIDGQRATILLKRFVMPGENISLTQVRVEPGDAVVARGEGLELNIQIEGRGVKSAQLQVRNQAGESERIPLEVSAASAAYKRERVNDRFDYRVIAGDGQTVWHTVEVADRPRLASARTRIRPPVYSKLPLLEHKGLLRQTRALEGSELELSFSVDQPGSTMALEFADGTTHVLEANSANEFVFKAILTNSLAYKPIIRNAHGLSNEPLECAIAVYEDERPQVELNSPEEAITARPDDKINIAFSASDDLGLESAELIVTLEGRTNEAPQVIPIPLGAQQGERQVRGEAELDLAQFELKQGEALSYRVRVTDNKNSSSTASAKGRPNASHPPHEMAMRKLDAGQSSECQPMKVVVDEWGQSQEMASREKLELAIDPVIAGLIGHLSNASSAVTNAVARLGAETAAREVARARDELTGADKLIGDLRAKSDGTPYAFIGLQLANIGATCIAPARQSLRALELKPSTTALDREVLQAAQLNIERARQQLEDLTRAYETVKRDFKIADAMQRLKKMHQIFLEDTQAMLGSSKPPINSTDRKVAEVDEAYVEKLRELLERKKEIMAELAKILASDPQMLRRFMAMQNLNATTLRDQLTLAARRQASLAEQLSAWQAGGEKRRGELLRSLAVDLQSEQAEVARTATQLNENFITWLPADVPPSSDLMRGLQQLATQIVLETTAAATSTNQNQAALKALEQLRLFHNKLPQMHELQSKGGNVAPFVANRLSEAGNLVTRQSAWLKKREALDAGDYPVVAQVDQHRLTIDTSDFAQKFEAALAMFAAAYPDVQVKAERLAQTLSSDVQPPQLSSEAALQTGDLAQAAVAQAAAAAALTRADGECDELIRLIVEKLDAEPPPSSPGESQTLEDLLALLEQEQQAAESLGIPCRPLNISILRDWMSPGSCSGSAQSQAAAMAAAAQAKQGAEDADRVGRSAARLARERSHAESEQVLAASLGPRRAAQSWNRLVSRLKDDLAQQSESSPPEQYRTAVENYFKAIAEQLPAAQR